MEVEDNIGPCPFGRGNVDLSDILLKDSEKEWFAKAAMQKRGAVRKLAQRFHLTIPALKKYAWIYKRGGTFHMKGGRPSLLTSKAENRLSQKLNNQHYQVPLEDLPKHFAEEAIKSNKERGMKKATDGIPSRSTLCRYKKKLNIKVRNAESTTIARYNACCEKRNAITFAAMCSILSKDINPALLINLDATQFTVGGGNHKAPKIVTTAAPHQFKVLPKKIKYNDSVAFFIKYYLIMTACGIVGNPLFVISDCRMSKDDIDTYKVEGLGIGSGIEDFGFVVFCQLRTGNVGLYSFMNEHVLIPMISRIRERYDLDVQHSPASIQLDGEKMQIDIYKHKSILEMLTAHNVNIVKSPASTTEIFQPCDVGNCFKSSKATNKTIRDADVDVKGPTYSLLQTMYDDHEKYVTSKFKEKKIKKMSAAHRRMGIYGLLRVQLALCTSLNSKIARESFTKAGIYPFNLRTICLQCKTPFTEEEIADIQDKMPDLEDLFRKHGEISDAMLQQLGLNCASTTSVDSLVDNRRRTVILTHPTVIEGAQKRRKL